MSALDIQCDMLNRENLALWVRPTMNDHGIMMTTELGQTSLVLGDEFPAPSYWRYGRMFSLNNNLILQSRYRPVRDTMDTIMRYSMLDHDPVHKIGSEYAMESCFSSLFFFLFDRQAWVKATVSGYPLPVCSCVVKSPNEKKAYFLSRINQGYELDSRTWKVKSLHLIGRPYSLSAGSALTMTPDNCVVAVGGSWVAWSEASLQGATKDLQKGSNTVRSKPPPKEVKRKEEMPIHRFYSNRLYILDLKTKRWKQILLEGDVSDWTPLGYATATAWKNKIIVIGGENRDGETQRVWVLERKEGLTKQQWESSAKGDYVEPTEEIVPELQDLAEQQEGEGNGEGEGEKKKKKKKSTLR
eukprot:TRINITY_DN10690_c0_g1_i8.p1 TRINITY_DN10690_c0_g1~~TRINITY_DN10690_c0_g1_i8.p1  ORF type:complete len:356 (-),score=63.10 TRINITY_DN10690_c0_g1_i8:12-1079(-)